MSDSDLDAIRAKAKELGVPYHPAQKIATIQENIDLFLEENAPTDIAPSQADETPKQRQARKIADALSLIPITLTSMDPRDAQVPSIEVSVGNRKIGQIRKVIPFGYKWYMPKILVKHLERQLYARSAMVPTPNGSERLNTQYIKKYGIVYHPMPSPADLEALAKAQAQGNELMK